MPRFSDEVYEAYGVLTSRTFYVVDTEYTPAPESEPPGNHIISIAIVPVIAGRRAPRNQEFYKVMNPGVPITPGTTHVHGFTDAAVANKPDFAAFAREIIDFFDEPNAVFVSHTGADIYALRHELSLLDARRAAGETTISVGLSDLPSMPLIDTSTLPRFLRYPGIGNRGIIGLGALTELTGVSFTNAHDARHDARATADALLKLFLHSAQTGIYIDLDELLRDHGAGNTINPARPFYIRSNATDEPLLPPGHFDKHLAPLTEPATEQQADAWVEMALACSRLRCPWLRDEAIVASQYNGNMLLDKTMAVLPTLTEPGQAGTLLGAIAELVRHAPDYGRPGIPFTRALRWWNRIKGTISSSVDCGTESRYACPDCREYKGCPKHWIYELIADIGTYGETREFSEDDLRKIFVENTSQKKWARWRINNPELFAWAEWAAITHLYSQQEFAQAWRAISTVIERGDHLIEPRLAYLACESLANGGEIDQALEIAQQALSNRTSNLAYNDLVAWISWSLSQLAAQEDPAETVSEHPRLARPPGRVPNNPYRVSR